jgi:hypothetical protein
MFELRNSGENRRKLSEIFFEHLPRAYKDLILVKKNSKISHACVPLSAFLPRKKQAPETEFTKKPNPVSEPSIFPKISQP